MATIEQRVSRLEGAYDHLATKADLADMKAELAEMKAELIKWMAGWTLGGMAAISAVVIAMLRFLG